MILLADSWKKSLWESRGELDSYDLLHFGDLLLQVSFYA